MKAFTLLCLLAMGVSVSAFAEAPNLPGQSMSDGTFAIKTPDGRQWVAMTPEQAIALKNALRALMAKSHNLQQELADQCVPKYQYLGFDQ